MENIILDTYLLSISDDDILIEGMTPALVKNVLKDMKNMKAKDVQSFLRKYSSKVKPQNEKKTEDEIDKVAEKNGIKKENVATSKVMLKRFLGSIFVGATATILAPITLACVIACIIRAIKKKESILKSVLAIIKEIKSGIKTTRRTNITNMEKAIITAGQTSEYLWSAISSDPAVILKNLLAFIGMYIVSVYYFFKGIIFVGEKLKDKSEG